MNSKVPNKIQAEALKMKLSGTPVKLINQRIGISVSTLKDIFRRYIPDIINIGNRSFVEHNSSIINRAANPDADVLYAYPGCSKSNPIMYTLDELMTRHKG